MAKRGFVRIIGGQYRGRKLKILEEDTLRPTPDRVRETLFNWLSPVIIGSTCLDLFAGSGALGFEALSRGAKSVVFVEHSHQIVANIKETLTLFQSQQGKVYQANALSLPFSDVFNIVFLDPPFNENLLLPSCFYLEEKNFLSKEAYIYLETNAKLSENDLPKEWHIIKNQQAGQVYYYLVKRG